ADANAPLTKQQLLADRYPLVSYHRRGFAGSESYNTDLPPTISQHLNVRSFWIIYKSIQHILWSILM
ncbi:MAG: hypothetical protein WBZ36_01845, partial [Candidatus Nitrosopolaris sp.]